MINLSAKYRSPIRILRAASNDAHKMFKPSVRDSKNFNTDIKPKDERL